jgi:hypothetical protein
MIGLMRRRAMAKVLEVPLENQYLTFEALESGTFQFSKACSYSINNGAWTALAAATDTPTLNTGDTIRWKATTAPASGTGVGTFSSTGTYNAMGNPLSMRNGDNFKTSTTRGDYLFQKMFYGSTGLINAEGLIMPSILQGYAWENMFNGCTSMIVGPTMPSELNVSFAECLYGMFANCSSLIATPVVELHGGSSSCCQSMFDGCTSLRECNITFSTDNIGKGGFSYMFRNCSSLKTGPATLPSELIANDNCSYIYRYMFNGCTSLESAPELPSAVIPYGGYMHMFNGCTSLKKAPAILATTVSTRGCVSMFYNCSSLTTPPVLSATTLSSESYNAMFYNCTSLETAPVLTLAVLPSSCYESMFWGCSKLSYIKCLATNITAGRCVINWVRGVASTGTFVKHPDATWGTGNSGIPSGWTVVDAVVE